MVCHSYAQLALFVQNGNLNHTLKIAIQLSHPLSKPEADVHTSPLLVPLCLEEYRKSKDERPQQRDTL